MEVVIGRTRQISELREALSSKKPEMVALVGRRRIGKTYLVRQVYEGRINFELTGIQHGDKAQQLQNFLYTMGRYFPAYELKENPKNWLAAFNELAWAMESVMGTQKAVVFLDELPWLGTRRSDFIKGLSYFWNSWASRHNIVLVVCGSAASWVINKVINDKGGLHNRVTRLLSLPPFTLAETEAFCKSRNIRLNRFQLLQLQMTIGGVPMYLDLLKPGLSATQNIQRICFDQSGFLRKEFDRLFDSLFNDPKRHIAIIKALAGKRKGLTRQEVIKVTGLPNGGAMTRNLEELEASGFITAYGGYKKRVKDQLYRLTDAYSLFYLTYIEPLGIRQKASFTELKDLPNWSSWSGYTFENICLAHTDQIKRALGINGVSTLISSFIARPADGLPGAQIDLLIDRSDHSINLVEAKFSRNTFKLTQAVMKSLRRKQEVFQYHTETKKHVFLTLITTHGVAGPEHLRAEIDQVITMDDLFVE